MGACLFNMSKKKAFHGVYISLASRATFLISSNGTLLISCLKALRLNLLWFLTFNSFGGAFSFGNLIRFVSNTTSWSLIPQDKVRFSDINSGLLVITWSIIGLVFAVVRVGFFIK